MEASNYGHSRFTKFYVAQVFLARRQLFVRVVKCFLTVMMILLMVSYCLGDNGMHLLPLSFALAVIIDQALRCWFTSQPARGVA